MLVEGRASIRFLYLWSGDNKGHLPTPMSQIAILALVEDNNQHTA